MTVNSKMTELADEVRELSGSTNKMSIDAMTNSLGETNAEVGNQADLIAQIKSAVDNLPEASGGSGEIDWISIWDEMLAGNRLSVGGGTVEEYFYTPTNVLFYTGSEWGLLPFDTMSELTEQFALVVVPHSIVDIAEGAFEGCYGDYSYLICLAETPPELGWQGAWAADGGAMPPAAIYVPDASVNTYKANATWTEYTDYIQPISAFNYDEIMEVLTNG